MRLVNTIIKKIGRYGFLLSFMCLMIGLKPFLHDLIERDLLADIFLIGILISGVYALDRDPIAFRISCGLTLSVITLKVLSHIISKIEYLHLVELILTALLIAQILWMILNHILIEQEVTSDIVMGGACAFILLGFLWAYAYYILETLEPNSLKGSSRLSVEPFEYMYFSFVTLTSTGYGDILPISQKARALAVLEAITGQLYLAIMISRLVSLHISDSQRH
jgi:hypothetical protein